MVNLYEEFVYLEGNPCCGPAVLILRTRGPDPSSQRPTGNSRSIQPPPTPSSLNSDPSQPVPDNAATSSEPVLFS